MKHISQRQGGMTALGIFIILAMIGCFIAFGIRVFPLYNEHMSIKSTMTSVLNQPAERRKTTKMLRELFVKNAKINGLYDFDILNVKNYLKVKKSKDGKKYLTFTYENRKPLFKNFYLLIDIEESLEIPGAKK